MADRDLAGLFKARAATFPDPSPELFTTVTRRLELLAPRRSRLQRWLAATSLGFRIRLSGGLTVAAIAVAIGFARFSHPAPGSEEPALLRPVAARQAAASLDSVPAAPKSVAGTFEAKRATDSSAQIAREETLGLLVRNVPAAIVALQSIARTGGGLVSDIDDTSEPDGSTPRTATVTLTVAAAGLDAALARVAALGGVVSHHATAESIGASIVDERARLRNLQREENDLLRIMDRSGSVSSILAVESKLAEVRGSIEELTAQLASSNHRVATATIAVTLTESPPAPAAALPSFGDHLATTWNLALRSLAAAGQLLGDCGVWMLVYSPVWIGLAIVAAVIVRMKRSRF